MGTQNVLALQQVPSLTPVKLQLLWKHQFEFAGFYAAKAKGFYQQAGLDVEIIPFKPGDISSVDKITRGEVDFAVGDTSVFIDRANGKPIKLLGNIFQHNPLVLLTRADSGIHSPAQMVGKKIMMAEHESANAAIMAMLDSESVSLDDMQVIEHDLSIDRFINGEVDIMTAYSSNEPGQLKQLGISFNVIDPLNYGFDFYGNNIYTHEKTVYEKQHIAEAFIKASLKGWHYALSHKNELIDLILNRYQGGKSREQLQYEANVIKNYILPDRIKLGNINHNRLKRIVAVYQDLGLIQQDFSYREILPPHEHEYIPELNLTAAEKKWIMENPTVRIGVHPAAPPFEYIDEVGKHAGMASEFINIIAQKTGLEFSLQKLDNWQQVIKSAQAGSLDILSAVPYSLKNKDFLDFTEPYLSYPMVILTNKKGEFISQVSDLHGKTVIVRKDYVPDDFLRSNHPTINVLYAQNIGQALERLSSGDADAFIDNPASITYSISQLGFSNLRISGSTPYEFSLSLGVVKDNPVLLSIMNKAMTSISDEERKSIRDKWISIENEYAIRIEDYIEIGLIIFAFILMMIFWNRKLAIEVKRREKYELDLIAKEKRFRELFENNRAIELIINPVTNQIVAANNAAINFYGYSKTEFGKLLITDLNILSPEEIQHEMEMAKEQKRTHFYLKHRLSSGEVKDVEVHSGPIDWDGKKLIYSIIHDVTDRTRAEKALVKAKSEAEKATRIKSDFLANMSHEIRTPMNSVLGMAELLRETSLSKEQEELLTILQSSGEVLITIINDILDFSKLEAGKMTLENVDFKLAPFIQETVSTFNNQAKAKNIQLFTEFEDNADIILCSDPVRIRQVMINLLGNAVKFTEKGSITTRINLQKNGHDTGQLSIQVIDTGIGLKQHEIDHLFESFSQAEQSTTRKFGGTGLGLTISQKIIHLLNGEINVDSSPGKGSTFSVIFSVKFKPLDVNDQSLSENTWEIPIPQRPRFQANVLIAEDVKPNRILIDKMLFKFGINSEFAENGAQAVEMASSNKYDLILMDCQMPVMDGYVATQKIRELNEKSPILALTANATEADRSLALASGMNQVLTKPIQLKVLQQALQKWLGHKQLNKVKTTTEEKNTVMNNSSVINYTTLQKLQDEMEDSFEEIYHTIFESFDHIVKELEKHPQDTETITRLFHSIKSPAASLGAEQLASLAAEYEKQARRQTIQDLDNLIQHLNSNIHKVKQELHDFDATNS